MALGYVAPIAGPKASHSDRLLRDKNVLDHAQVVSDIDVGQAELGLGLGVKVELDSLGLMVSFGQFCDSCSIACTTQTGNNAHLVTICTHAAMVRAPGKCEAHSPDTGSWEAAPNPAGQAARESPRLEVKQGWLRHCACTQRRVTLPGHSLRMITIFWWMMFGT